MRVGILTSWRVPCGVYQYSARLADAFASIGHCPVVLAGRADEHRSVPEESDYEVYEVGEIGLWRDDGTYQLDVNQIVLGLQLDVVHVQYQSMLFQQHELAKLACMWHREPRPIAVTFHDKCQRHDFPYNAFDLRFSHRQNVGIGTEVIPFGIEDRPPVVRTFGLGRTQSDLIRPVCERNGWIFEDASTHEPIQGGGQAWRSHEDLIAWLRGADAIVLWYPPQPMAGSSQAARTAMAARRPVLTNNTEWFEDLPDGTFSDAHQLVYRKVQRIEDLGIQLTNLFHSRYVADNSWDNVARLLVDRYQSVA